MHAGRHAGRWRAGEGHLVNAGVSLRSSGGCPRGAPPLGVGVADEAHDIGLARTPSSRSSLAASRSSIRMRLPSGSDRSLIVDCMHIGDVRPGPPGGSRHRKHRGCAAAAASCREESLGVVPPPVTEPLLSPRDDLRLGRSPDDRRGSVTGGGAPGEKFPPGSSPQLCRASSVLPVPSSRLAGPSAARARPRCACNPRSATCSTRRASACVPRTSTRS